MKRLLLLLVALLITSCSDSTGSGDTPALHNIPKVGSTLTTRLAYRAFDTTSTDTVMITGLRYDGKSNVMMLTDSTMVAFEDNGDISLPYNTQSGWVRIPVSTKQSIVFDSGRNDHSPGNYYTYERQVNFLNIKTQVIQGKNYESLRFEIKDVYKFYQDGVLVTEDVPDVLRIGWIPEIGWYGLTEHESPVNSDPVTQELIAFELK